MQQLSVPHGGPQLSLQAVGPLGAEHRVQQVALHLQQAEALLQLGAALQQTLEQEEGREGT